MKQMAPKMITLQCFLSTAKSAFSRISDSNEERDSNVCVHEGYAFYQNLVSCHPFLGPQFWGGFCKGQSQSPINLEFRKAKFQKEDPFVFEYYDAIPDQSQLENVGSTVKLKLKFKDGNKTPKVQITG